MMAGENTPVLDLQGLTADALRAVLGSLIESNAVSAQAVHAAVQQVQGSPAVCLPAKKLKASDGSGHVISEHTPLLEGSRYGRRRH